MHLLRRLLAASPSCRPSGSRAFAAAATNKDPRSWVMLNKFVRCRGDEDGEVADAGTTAEAHSSTGRNLQVSLGRAAPPASSFLYAHWAGGDALRPEKEQSSGVVLAAHGDSVLLQVRVRQDGSPRYDDFVYVAGADDRAKPPSLSLLPASDYTQFFSQETGLLRRGEDELLVVTLDWSSVGSTYDKDEAYLSVHRVGSGRRWEMQPAVPIADGRPRCNRCTEWDSFTTVPVGDRFVCWVDYHNGVLVCDMANDTGPKIRHAPMPEIDDPDSAWEPDDRHDGNGRDRMYTWNMGAAGASALRYVTVDPRCCCGDCPTRNQCPHSDGTFSVTTWTLDLETMAWAKEGRLECEELWALPGYADAGLPREETEFPVVSLDNADVVCFVVRGWDTEKETWGEKWTVEVDTRKKALRSVCPFVPGDAWLAHVSAKL